MRRSEALMQRMSAGTTSPVSTLTMSPGTMSRDSMVISSPLRMTFDIGDCREESAARASLALFSVTAAMVALMSTMIMMAMESMYDRTLAEFLPVALMAAEAMTA